MGCLGIIEILALSFTEICANPLHYRHHMAEARGIEPPNDESNNLALYQFSYTSTLTTTFGGR